jgi:hypothetical protein
MALNLKLLKLISGEEIFGEVTENGNEVTIKNPVRVIIVPSKANPQSPTVAFGMWAEFSEEKEFTIHKAHVIVMMNPVKEFVNNYNSMFGGIVTPSSKLILPGA